MLIREIYAVCFHTSIDGGAPGYAILASFENKETAKQFCGLINAMDDPTDFMSECVQYARVYGWGYHEGVEDSSKAFVKSIPYLPSNYEAKESLEYLKDVIKANKAEEEKKQQQEIEETNADKKKRTEEILTAVNEKRFADADRLLDIMKDARCLFLFRTQFHSPKVDFEYLEPVDRWVSGDQNGVRDYLRDHMNENNWNWLYRHLRYLIQRTVEHALKKNSLVTPFELKKDIPEEGKTIELR